MAKNTMATKLGRVGKVQSKIANPGITPAPSPSVKDIDAELGNRGSVALGKVKREPVKTN